MRSIQRNFQSLNGCLRESFLRVHGLNHQHSQLRDEDDEHQEQASYPDVGKRSDHLRTGQRKGSASAGKPVPEGADREDLQGQSDDSQA